MKEELANDSSQPMTSTDSASPAIHPREGCGLHEAPMDPLQPEPQLNDNEETELYSVSWNQDSGCFAAGTSHGFSIYNCNPFKETFRRDLKTGGFKIIEMLFRCNILALVGTKINTQYPPNNVIIWDDFQSRCIGEFSFRSEIRAVKLRRDRVVVVLEHKIYVYNFMDLKLLHQIETLANPRGLCCLSHHPNTSVLACPGLQRGQVRVEHFGLNRTTIINAHDSKIACLTLTMDGLLLATASLRGTLIRIFNTMDGTRLQEVRCFVQVKFLEGSRNSRVKAGLLRTYDKSVLLTMLIRSTPTISSLPPFSDITSISGQDGLEWRGQALRSSLTSNLFFFFFLYTLENPLVRLISFMENSIRQPYMFMEALEIRGMFRVTWVRRGVDRADIYNIALSPNVQWLAVSSDKGTVHIFSLRVRGFGDHRSTDSTAATGPISFNQSSSNALEPLITRSANPSSSFSFLKGVLPKYFSSEWSFAQFHFPGVTQFITTFGSQNTVIVVGLDGSFYRCSFDPVNGGEMVKQEYVRFLKTEAASR
ncbi:hypothetical protein SASPL_120738 [Salvia splendens]|uniref:Autophagy-related protein 18 n=1 Tax=Salvia splendens TaxID=180675 RepID=A0A8X8XT15_SALSN|nr:hypothetical protein SASPL_120738 [Salvia splendens]